jgi:hypothetical protein
MEQVLAIQYQSPLPRAFLQRVVGALTAALVVLAGLRELGWVQLKTPAVLVAQ